MHGQQNIKININCLSSENNMSYGSRNTLNTDHWNYLQHQLLCFSV